LSQARRLADGTPFTGTGSEVMQRIAVPMIGGMISSTALTLIVIPAVYWAGACYARKKVTVFLRTLAKPYGAGLTLTS
jgi:hypothetical protein